MHPPDRLYQGLAQGGRRVSYLRKGLWLLLLALPPPSSRMAERQLFGAHPWCHIPGSAVQLLPPSPGDAVF